MIFGIDLVFLIKPQSCKKIENRNKRRERGSCAAHLAAQPAHLAAHWPAQHCAGPCQPPASSCQAGREERTGARAFLSGMCEHYRGIAPVLALTRMIEADEGAAAARRHTRAASGGGAPWRVRGPSRDRGPSRTQGLLQVPGGDAVRSVVSPEARGTAVTHEINGVNGN